MVTGSSTNSEKEFRNSPITVILAWTAVGLPLLWGVAQTIRKTLALFA